MSGLVTNGSLGNTTSQPSFNVTSEANPKNQTHVNKAVVNSKGVNGNVERMMQTQRENEVQTAAGRVLNELGQGLGQLWDYACITYDTWRNGPRPKISLAQKDRMRTSAQEEQRVIHIQQLESLEDKVTNAINDVFLKGWNKLSVEKAAVKLVEYMRSDVFCNEKEGRKWLNKIIESEGELIEAEQQDLAEALDRILEKDKNPRITKRRLALEKNIFSALKTSLWDEPAKKRIVDSVLKYLESGVSKNREDVKKWIAEVLEENLPWDNFKQTTRSLRRALSEKRDVFPFTLSEKMAIDSNSGLTADTFTTCGSGTEVMFHYATNTSQVVQLYSLQNNTLSRIAAASDAINGQMPGRLGSNYISSACKGNTYQIITLSAQKPGPSFYHTTIRNQSLAIPQYPVNVISTSNTPIPAYAPRPTIINDRLTLGYYPSNLTSSLIGLSNFVSNTSGYFSGQQASGLAAQSEWKANKVYQEAFSLEDENLIFLQDAQASLDVPGLVATMYNASDIYPFLHAINYGYTNLTQDIYNQTSSMPYVSRTPLPVNLLSTSLIHQIANLSTVLHTLDMNSLMITSSKILPDAPQELIANATMSIAHCPQPQRSNAHVYVREIFNGIKFDLLDSADGTSLLGGEQTYTNITMGSARPQPGTACLDNGNIILSFLDGDKPVRIRLKVDEPTPVAPTNPPTTVPTAPTVAPTAPVASPSPEQIFTPDGSIVFTIRLPDGTTGTFTGGQIFVFDESITTVNLINLNGWKVTDSNGIEVKPGTYTIGQALGFNYNNENAAPNTGFDAQGCTDEGRCNNLSVIFDTGSNNVAIIASTVSVGGAIGFTALAIFLIKKLWYDQKQKDDIDKYKKNRIIITDEKV